MDRDSEVDGSRGRRGDEPDDIEKSTGDALARADGGNCELSEVIVPRFRNREPAFGSSQKASPQLVVR